MPISPSTNHFMRALPATLRPNPYNIDELVMEAVENGWETDALAKACYINERRPNPAFVVTNLRTLCKYPPKQQTVRNRWAYGHLQCGDLHHGPDCEICRCIPGEVNHHIPAYKSDKRTSLPKIGVMPE